MAMPASLCAAISAFWVLFFAAAHAELTSGFYDSSCPSACAMVSRGVERAVQKEPRMAASLIRLHFHDCFVNVATSHSLAAVTHFGCDGSNLLDDTDDLKGEKSAGPNRNSARGFDVIDDIKAEIERSCEGVVSCADILAIAARDSTLLSGGPSWTVLLGRRDSKTASFDKANTDIPGPSLTATQLVAKFEAKGLSSKDMVTLSGAHTLGKAHCSLINDRFRNFNNTGAADPSIRPWFVSYVAKQCSNASDNDQLADLDNVTPIKFDNKYYENLIRNMGVLRSDQALYSTAEGDTKDVVKSYCGNEEDFFADFGMAMVKMGNIIGNDAVGEIRKNCRVRNH